MLLIEGIRSETVRHVMALPTFAPDWEVRREALVTSFANPAAPTRAEVLALGARLSDIFRLVGKGDRSNASVSGGGAVWSGLVCWYLNLCLAGTHAIAFNAGRAAPKVIRDAMTVTHSNTPLRADTDVLIVSLPLLATEKSPAKDSHAARKAALDKLIADHFDEVGVVNLQCKTNWNDNAQIPMLWNLVYQQAMQTKTPPAGFVIGSGGYHIRNLAYFAYAFCTVPTSNKGKPEAFRPDSTPVYRVESLSGGAYWGHPGKKGVCRSLDEFFGHQYAMNSACMPNVSAAGKGYAASVPKASRNSLCDADSFGLLHGDGSELL